MRDKIMIFEDNAPALQALGAMLGAAGFDVVSRSTAIGAGGAIARERPALVLVDASLPLLTSTNIAETLRASTNRHGAVVVLRSDAPAADLEDVARRCGAVGVVPRRGGTNMVVAEIRRLLARRDGAAPLGERRRGQMREIVVAARPETCAWARHLFRACAVVRATDSGTEALGRMTAKTPPDAVLLGTALLDMPAHAVWTHATRLDARWRRRIVVVEEDGAANGVGHADVRTWSSRLPDSVVLTWLGLAGDDA